MTIEQINLEKDSRIQLLEFEATTYDHMLGVPPADRSDCLTVGVLTDIHFPNRFQARVKTAEANFRRHKALQDVLNRTSLQIVPVNVHKERLEVSAEYTIDHEYGFNYVLVKVGSESKRNIQVGTFVGQTIVQRIAEVSRCKDTSTKAQLLVDTQPESQTA